MDSKEKILPSLITRLSYQREPLTAKELAELLRVSPRTIYNLITNDGLPVIKIGSTIRIDPVNAARWLRTRQIK